MQKEKEKSGEREKGEHGRDYISRGIHEVEYEVGARTFWSISKTFPFFVISFGSRCLTFVAHNTAYVGRGMGTNWKWSNRTEDDGGDMRMNRFARSCGQPNDVNMRDIYWAIKLNIWSRIRCNPISRSCVRSNFMTRKLPRRSRRTRQIALIALE